ncbi:MAG TPA: MoaD/ThiS family protein [Casimicrobiaceae bacterium]|nr:MoaD/ThiS family protein [Casimicrobiaceae bacterium]
MTVQLVYLARLRESLGRANESVALSNGATVAKLLDDLRSRGGAYAAELAPGRAYRVAVNHALAGATTTLQEGDEVALLPPVTGG